MPAVDGLEWSADGPIGRISLRRPAKLNALSRSVLEGLVTATAWFDERPEVKAVVVSGEGRAFSAGFDLADRSWAELGPPEQSAAVGRAAAEALAGLQAITVGAVQGHCIGGGVVLAAACDLRIAADDARFRIPEIDLGVPLYWAGIPLLTRELGAALTKELVLTGRSFDAEEALRMRFVNRVVPADQLAAATDELVQVLAAKSAFVLHTTKRQVHAAAPPVPAGIDGVDVDVRAMATAARDPESRAIARGYRRPG